MCESVFKTAGERYGMCESVFKTAGERHGMCESVFKTAGERYGMCESVFKTAWEQNGNGMVCVNRPLRFVVGFTVGPLFSLGLIPCSHYIRGHEGPITVYIFRRRNKVVRCQESNLNTSTVQPVM
jgi:hypothetical protein